MSRAPTRQVQDGRYARNKRNAFAMTISDIPISAAIAAHKAQSNKRQKHECRFHGYGHRDVLANDGHSSS